MAKFEYMITVWDYSMLSKKIRVFDSEGEIEVLAVKIEGLGNTGEAEMIDLANSLGAEEWEMFEVTSIDYGRGNFTKRCFFRRPIKEGSQL